MERDQPRTTQMYAEVQCASADMQVAAPLHDDFYIAGGHLLAQLPLNAVVRVAVQNRAESGDKYKAPRSKTRAVVSQINPGRRIS